MNILKEIAEIKKRIDENKAILNNGEDPDLIPLAEEEIKKLLEKEKALEKNLADSLKKNAAENNTAAAGGAVVMEIRAGAGGEEATLFAADLFRMYSRCGQIMGWNQKILDSHPTELGGYKEIIFELKNGDVWSRLQAEAGVHRVQRIPKTEKSGRVHTSTASVAVLLKPKKTQIQIKPSDLRIDYYRSSGPGGQYVNKRETAVRITHLPSGLMVASQTQRNQLQNKENAMAILEARLMEKKELEETGDVAEKRKAQIKRAKRAEKIRTYNFPQDRVTDHRIKKSWHDIEGIMDGNIEPLIKALQKSAPGVEH